MEAAISRLPEDLSLLFASTDKVTFPTKLRPEVVVAEKGDYKLIYHACPMPVLDRIKSILAQTSHVSSLEVSPENQ